MKFANYLVGRIQRMLYGRAWTLKFALKLRNQANMMIARHAVGYDSSDDTGEHWLIEQIAGCVSTFLDVGANIGDWTSHMLKHSSQNARGYLFDASEECSRRLKDRFASHGNLTIIRKALGDRRGTVTFFAENGAGNTSSVLRGSAKSCAKPEVVELSTLDAEIERLAVGQVDFLKIDCEGYDGHVIAGAEALLTQGAVRFLQFEYQGFWQAARSTLAEALNTLERCSYSVYLIKPQGLEPFDYSLYGEFFGYSNFLAARADGVTLLQERGLIRGSQTT